jgi:hypothetical protein
VQFISRNRLWRLHDDYRSAANWQSNFAKIREIFSGAILGAGSDPAAGIVTYGHSIA